MMAIQRTREADRMARCRRDFIEASELGCTIADLHAVKVRISWARTYLRYLTKRGEPIPAYVISILDGDPALAPAQAAPDDQRPDEDNRPRPWWEKY